MQQLFPDHIIPWEDFAHKLPNDANALNELYQLCQQEPMWGGVRKALGIVMRKTGLLQEAITVFENGCKYIPNWPGAGVLYEIGLVYLQMGDYQAAQLSFKEALERRPNFIEAMEKLQDVSLFFQ